MLTKKTMTSLLGAAAGAWLIFAPMAQAATYSDTGAAVLVWPRISVDADTDTVITLTNQSSNKVAAHCFYVNGNNRCTNTGEPCETSDTCVDDSGVFGQCRTGWIEVNFDVILTPNQPVAWSAATGLSGNGVPCPGDRIGRPDNCPGSNSNAGTAVPPVGETPFIGELKCIEADPVTRLPAPCQATLGHPCPNDLEGTATLTSVDAQGIIDTQEYNAVGLRTTGFNDGNNVLVIGGNGTGPAAAEYQPCSEVLILNHLFDGAVDPISGDDARSELSLVPCTEDFLTQTVPTVTAQFLVYNEFEQRFSTSRSVNCLLTSQISLLDTTQPTRSIFSVGTAGTVAGQTRITGVNGGLIGSATLNLCAAGLDPTGGCLPSTGTSEKGAAYNLNQFADRSQADFIRVP